MTLRPISRFCTPRFSSLLCSIPVVAVIPRRTCAHLRTQRALPSRETHGPRRPVAPCPRLTARKQTLVSVPARASDLTRRARGRARALRPRAPELVPAQRRTRVPNESFLHVLGTNALRRRRRDGRNFLRARLKRWTAHRSAARRKRIFRSGGGVVYSSNPRDPIPMRVQKWSAARSFAPISRNIGADVIRTAEVMRDGKELTCMLLSGVLAESFGAAAMVTETEYCFDADTGLLHTWSEAPGAFTPITIMPTPFTLRDARFRATSCVTEGSTAILQNSY